MKESFYWHDYETFGIDPARDRPAQFAGIRTDEDLNPIEDPLMLYCRPSEDYLPDPNACLITGITPDKAREHGVTEAEFSRRIHQAFTQPGTCALGYNSLRFDDEVTRHTLYRNLFDPYAREWKNHNSRWDIIDVTRALWALRPDSLRWPRDAANRVSFRLDQLTLANAIEHSDAHDALADVQATIALAKRIKTNEAKLFDYFFRHRRKAQINSLLDLHAKKPVLHISGMYSATHRHAALVIPLVRLPDNPNGIVVYDLSVDPSELLNADVATLQARLFTKASDLVDPALRVALKTIHINRCPIILPVSLLQKDQALQQRLQIDINACRRHYDRLKSADVGEKIIRIMHRDWETYQDPELQLYSGPFFSTQDHALLTRIQDEKPAQLSAFQGRFQDSRLEALLWRYRARNYPHTLTSQEQKDWHAYCHTKLHKGDQGHRSLAQYAHQIKHCQLDEINASQRITLDALVTYGQHIGQILNLDVSCLLSD